MRSLLPSYQSQSRSGFVAQQRHLRESLRALLPLGEFGQKRSSGLCGRPDLTERANVFDPARGVKTGFWYVTKITFECEWIISKFRPQGPEQERRGISRPGT